MAPRPHNSGHLTQDACATSQFEQQVRAVAGLPLGDSSLLAPAAMVNVLGDAWNHGTPPWAKWLALPGAHLHLYGKREARAGRKMGHINFVGERAANHAEAIAAELIRLAETEQSPIGQ
jgi:5-(carboxyamino)imidazole ribonucleotide synthase